MAFAKIAILGPGLLGGSLALALKERKLAERVAVWGRSEKAIREILGRNLATEASSDPKVAVADADLVILCTPLGVMGDLCRSFLPALDPRAIVTDVASVKGPVDAQLAPLLRGKASWIGSHPMAGKEKAGLEAACGNLFQNACCILTPTDETSPEALATVRVFWEALGSRVVELSPADHDRLVAQISHLPHLLAALLVQAVDPKALPLAGTGFRDTTRIAAGPAPMWAEILLNNREALLQGLDALSLQIENSRNLLNQKDEKGLQELLSRANDVRKSLG